MGKYTLETLSEINSRFIGTHYVLLESDVNMVNEYVKLIEESRDATMPKAGDMLQYTNKYGEYYDDAHIERIEDGEANICEGASVSIHKTNDNTEIAFSSSGGTWHYIPINKFKYIGKAQKRFWDFGHCGACADGGIEFFATVNVWEYNENEMEFSTKTHDKYYLSYSEETVGCGYHFLATKQGMGGHAWKTEKELQSWLRTYRAVIQPTNFSNIVVWAYKEMEHHVSPDEYGKINGIEDIMSCNGKRRCKRIYDDKTYTLHTYFVWYWQDETMGDFYEQLTKQNEIRKQYEVHYTTPKNIYAVEELRRGDVKPIEIMKYFEIEGDKENE